VSFESNEVMTSLPQRVAAIASPVAQAARTTRVALQPARRKLLVSVTGTLTGAAILTPWSWWRDGAQLVARPGWRWVPVLLLAAGLTGLAQLTARWWSRSGSDRRRPVGVQAPLFVHVGVLLLIAVAVAAAVGAGMWLIFGRPHLSVPGIATPAGTTGGTAVWSVQNTFDAMKIVLSVVAGIGGVVALTVGYRKQGHSEAAEHREDTKLFNDRFGKAADEIGSDKAAVRLAGVYAMAGLADDWAEGRQTCIDVLCAYLRMPYTPPPAPVDTPSPAVTTPTELPLRYEVRPDYKDARQEQQVRHTVLALIREHLLPAGADARLRWHDQHFNLNGAVFDGGSLSSISVTAGIILNLRDATFSGGTVDFSDATFSGGTVNFNRATFPGGTVNFNRATFPEGTVDFSDATFSGGTVNFNGAEFSGGTVDFNRATFSGGTVDFSDATFSGGTVNFNRATFPGGTVNFLSATFSGSDVNFRSTKFSGGTVDFTWADFFFGPVDFTNADFSGGTVDFIIARFSGGSVIYANADFSGGTVDFNGARFSSGTVNFAIADFSGSTVNFNGTTFSGSAVDFNGARFSGSAVDFNGARFSGGTVELSDPFRWRVPPVGIDRSNPAVLWPSPEHLVAISRN
jgi:uncharacterized protein YjbI with pentapeptide repeats